MDTLKGVKFNDPPAPLLDAIRASAIAVTGELKPSDSGAVVLIPTTQGVNAAVVARMGGHWFVTGFIGKEWGEPLRRVDAGAAVQFRW